MSEYDSILESISETIIDYRSGEIYAPSPAHIEKWVSQFNVSIRTPLLKELDHVLKKTYISKVDVEQFIANLVKNKKFSGDNPCLFWKKVKFLNIQKEGNSQREFLQLFNGILKKECYLSIDDCGQDAETYLYLDDIIFSGNHVCKDLNSWIQSGIPQHVKVHVVVMAYHQYGRFNADRRIQSYAQKAGKQVDITWWTILTIENRRKYIDTSDVLRPVIIPEDIDVQNYVHDCFKNYKPLLRKAGNVGVNKFFSSESGRHLLEQEFLKVGVHIKLKCPYLQNYQRPLGNDTLESLGFGSLLVTFRNCPNNCPLAFWVGDPWYPLFPRKTN